MLPGKKPQDRIFEARRNEIILQRAFILEILLRFSARYLVQRRLRNEEMPAIDELAHLPIEEREQKRADMRAIDVGVGHDDLVIPHLLRIELVTDPRAERRDQCSNFLTREHLVETRALDVENLAAQRQHRLECASAAMFGRAPGAVTLDDKDLRLGGVTFLAVRELPRQRGHAERRFSRHLARLARRLARRSRLNDLVDDDLGL